MGHYALTSAAIQLSPNLDELRIYIQRSINAPLVEIWPNNSLREKQLVAASDVSANTPIAAITLPVGGAFTQVGPSFCSHTRLLRRIINGQIHVFYVNAENRLSDVIFTRDSGWKAGTLSTEGMIVASDSRFLYAVGGSTSSIALIRVGFISASNTGAITEARFCDGYWKAEQL
jgi:hypothetical protein